MTDLIALFAASTVTIVGGIVFLGLVIWRRRKPPGQWLSAAAIAAVLLTANLADWATVGSGWSAFRALLWFLNLATAMVSFLTAAGQPPAFTDRLYCWAAAKAGRISASRSKWRVR